MLFAEQLPQALFPNLSPTRLFIDESVLNRPVLMLSDSEHEALLNTKALEREGVITADTPVPFGGEIVKDAAGQPTGWLKGRHQVAHAVVVHPDDLPRFQELDATAEFSPIFWMPSPLSGGLSVHREKNSF